MIEKVIHLADIHIRKSLKRHTEYRVVLQETIDSIRKHNPDRIVLVGDLYHDFIDIEGEALVIATWFLRELSKICKVVVTRGNHDFMKKNKNRYDVIQTITKMIEDSNIDYLDSTGFFIDDNITWAVWHHPDKQGPWKTVEHSKDNNQTYVDLFHDPVRSCMTPHGWPLEKGIHIVIDDFEGDIGMFGDIHLQQDMDKDSKKCYSGSLIQQSFDEKIYGHGFLIWDIKNESYTFEEIKSDWKHIEIILDKDIDYDNLNIKIEETFPHMFFKVKWTDTRNNIHRINQSKIREHLKTYNPLDIKWDKTIINTGEMEVDDEIRKNINDPEVQRKVFKEYLSEMGYDDSYINKVIDLDKLIFERLPNIERVSSDYQVQALWLDNFKSYDNDVLVNWDDNDGIIQITGENQVGKTTLLDGICYVLFGKTLSTLKKQKHGDSRFINNKRDLNYCGGWVVLKINEKRYLLKRSTNKKMHKVENRVTSVTTEFFIYDLVDLDIEEITPEVIAGLDVDDSLTGERYLDTQKYIEKSIGTFDDFIRVVLINADNLNDLLSIDRASFIDSIMRYAGYMIFEDKLDEFKEFKKEESRKIDKVVLNINDENDDLDNLIKEEILLRDSIIESEKELNTSKEKQKELLNDKEEHLRNLINVSDDIKNFNPSEVEQELETINSKISSIKTLIEETEKELSTTCTDKEIKEANGKIEVYKAEIEEHLKTKDSNKEELVVLNTSKRDKESKITLQEHDRDSKIKSLKNTILHKVSECDIKMDSFINEVQYIIKDAKNLKKEIDDLETSKECNTCGQTLKDDTIDKIKESINAKKEDLKNLKLKHSEKSSEIEVLNKDKESLQSNIDDIETSEEKSLIIKEFDNNVKLINDEIVLINEKAMGINNNIDDSDELITNTNFLLGISENITKDNAYKIDLNQTINGHKLKIEEYKIEIKNSDANMILYKANQKSIEHNNKINELITNNNLEISKVDSIIDSMSRTLNQYRTNVEIKVEDIKNKNIRIDKYKEQVALQEVYKIYQKCVSRDGIPTMLLRRSIGVINDEMSSILIDQNFICYFDEDLNLMTSHLSKLSSSQNVIESSGKERTFIALALKLALRAINNTSKPNIILLDEIMGKLINSSVNEFITVLDRVKEIVEKVVIIEHIHPINYDWRIHVEINDDGISNCELM